MPTTRPFNLMFFPLLLLVLVTGCSADPDQPPPPAKLQPVAVQLQTIELEPVPNSVEIMGTVQAVHQAEIAAKISGNITRLPVVLGSKVKQGDLLVEISAGEITAQLQRSQAQLEQAKRNLAREQKLLERKAATPETVKSFQDALRIAEASFREATTMQGYTRILAPFTGTITRKRANTGDLAVPGKILLHLEDVKQLQVISDIPETLILRIQQGDVLDVHIPAAELTFAATVAEIAPTADPVSRTAPVKLDVPYHPHLRSGQFARVLLQADTAATLTVPASAIRPLGQMERVYVVDGGIARLRLIRSGARFEDKVEVLSGMHPGEQVVVFGHENLVDGQPVVVK